MNKILSIKQLTVEYDSTTIISNLSFELTKGDFLCVVGPNGSGKSTLLKTILGLVKPKSGTINVAAKTLGYMPQENKISDIVPASVAEIVETGTLNQNLSRKKKKKRIAASLKTLGISKLRQKTFSELSGGQRQKALLARAITASNELLILDEPSNNLDHRSKLSFYAALSQLNESGYTIIMVTHDLDHDNLVGNMILSLDPSNRFFGATTEYVERIHHDH